MIKVLLVDDHKIIRDGLKAILMGSSNVNIVGECNNGQEALQYLEENQPDVIMMDINMPVMNGIEASKIIVEKYPNVKILALTMHQEESYISKILGEGVHGYILKNSGRKDLVNAIQKVHEGGTYFSEEVSSIMMNKYMKGTSGSTKSSPRANLITIEDLTRREIEILQLIVEEFTNVEIGERLFISPRTVDTHRRNLLQKIGVKNTAGLVKYAIQNNLVE